MQIKKRKKSLKVALFMIPLLTQGGGAEKYFIEVARNLSQSSVQADIITLDEHSFRTYARLIFFLYRVRIPVTIKGRESEKAVISTLGKATWKKTAFKKLLQTLKDYDVIYTKNEIFDLTLLKYLGYHNLPPLIVGIHTTLHYPNSSRFYSKLHNFIYRSPLYHWLLQGTKYLHAPNKAMYRFGQDVLKKKTFFIPYPFSVDNTLTQSRSIKTNLSFNKDRVNLMFCGRLGEQKGTDIFIAIAKILTQKGYSKKIHFHIFGSGEEKEFAKDLGQITRKDKIATYYGHVKNRYIPSILTKQNFLISTSRWETLPYNILEAQAVGIPVIAFDIPGPQDIIWNGRTGFLVKDKLEFVKKLSDIVDHRICFDKRTIINYTKAKFDDKKIYQEMLTMLFSAL